MGVWAQSTSIPYNGFEEGRRPIFRLDDVDYIKNRIPEIEYVAPGLQAGAFSGSPPLVVRGTKSDNFNIFGNFPVYAKISVIKIFDGGRYINDDDIKYERKVAVIGEGTQERLFTEGEDPLGKYIEINNIKMKKKILISTGGSGGHVIPATTIYDHLKNNFTCPECRANVDIKSVNITNMTESAKEDPSTGYKPDTYKPYDDIQTNSTNQLKAVLATRPETPVTTNMTLGTRS